MHRIYHLRSQLMPYIYSSVRQCHTDMLPLNRGMYIEYPDEEKPISIRDNFSSVTSCWVLPSPPREKEKKKIATQEVWLPGGTDWYNFFTGERQEGGQVIKTKARWNNFHCSSREVVLCRCSLIRNECVPPAHRIDRTLLSGQRRSKQYLYPVRRRRTDPRLPAREVCHHTPQLSEIRGQTIITVSPVERDL